MKRVPVFIMLAAAAILVLQQAFAQVAKPKPVKSEAKGAAAIPEVPVTLGNSGLTGGAIGKKDFDAALKQGIRLSGDGTILGFNFSYGEHTMYEDSAGNPLRVTDYLSEYCEGPSLSSGVSASIYQRTKPGDTAYFDRIKVTLSTGSEARGKPMKFWITGR